MSRRKEKLVALKELADLETGKLYTDLFEYENSLYQKAVQMKSLAFCLGKCKKCPSLNIKRLTEAAPGWGNLNAGIFFIGQSLHEPGVSSGIPFILGCGYCIDASLRLSGLLRGDVFMTNVVHCHPEKNRTSTEGEKKNCAWYLWQEVYIVQPKLIIALGNDAKDAVDSLPSLHITNTKIKKMRHPASFLYGGGEQRIDWIVKLSLEIDKIL